MCTYIHTYGKKIVWLIYASYQMSWIDSKGYRNSDGLNVTVLIMFTQRA